METIMNNWIIIGVGIGGLLTFLKVIAKITKTTKDDKIVTLLMNIAKNLWKSK